jgi:hypothetical protein
VPRRGARERGHDGAYDDADGYVVALVHADAGKSIQIFDAAAISQGPIATASAPAFNPPLGLHSAWAARREGPRPSSYQVDSRLDAWETLADFGADPGTSTGIGRAIFDSS